MKTTMKKRYLPLCIGLCTAATMATAAPKLPTPQVNNTVELLGEDTLELNALSKPMLQHWPKPAHNNLLTVPLRPQVLRSQEQSKPDLIKRNKGEEQLSAIEQYLAEAKVPDFNNMPTPQSDGNDNPNQASFVPLETAQANFLTKDNDQDWYFVQAPDAGKLTFFLQVPNNADLNYNLNIFRLDNGSLVEQQFSSYPAQLGEQIAVEANAGDIYFFVVSTVQGFSTTEPYAFIATHNTDYDAVEPDDNIWQANQESATRIINNSLDNTFDADVYQVSFADDTTFGIYYKPHADLPSQVDVLDSSGMPVAVVTDRNIYNFPAGTYFLRVKQTADAALTPAQRTYKLHTYMPGNLKAITNYSLSGSTFEGIYKVEDHCIRLSADVYDVHNTPVPFANIPYQVYQQGWDGGWPNRIKSGTATADENGKLSHRIGLSWTMSTNYDIDSIYLLDPSFATPVPLMSDIFIHYWTSRYGC